MTTNSNQPVMVIKPDKGKENGSCNREACQQPGATFFNVVTRAYYCLTCTRRIMSYPGGDDLFPDFKTTIEKLRKRDSDAD